MYKRKTFKVSSLLLVVCMLVQLIGVQVSAATQEKVYDSLDMKITFKLVSSWEGGYNAEISINNPTNASYEDWALEMVTGDKIAGIWNAGLTEKEAGKYQVTNLGYNQDVKAGKTVTFGYTASTSFTEYPEIKALKKQYVKADASKYSVDYKVISDWGSGANAELAVTNKSDANMAEWKLTFAYVGEITNIWNAKILSHENGVYVIAGNDYNQNLNAGATVTAGFTIGSGSKDLNVSDVVLEEYGYASEEIIDDDNHETLEEIYAFCDTDFVYIDGSSETLYIYAICEDETKTVNLYEESLGLICEMKDDGNYAVSGDDMSGDGIVSAKYEIPATTSKAQDLSFYASDGTSKSNSVEVRVRVPLTQEQIEEKNYVDKIINDTIDAENTAEDRFAAAKKACEELLKEGKIKSYYANEDHSGITIYYNTGLIWGISFVPLNEYTSGSEQGLSVERTNSDGKDRFEKFKKTGKGYSYGEVIADAVKDLKLNDFVQIAFFNTCEASTVFYKDKITDKDNAFDNDERFFAMADVVKEQVEDEGVKGVYCYTYPNGTIEDLYSTGAIKDKDLIFIMGHGGSKPENKLGILCTNDKYETSKYYTLEQQGLICHVTSKLGDEEQYKDYDGYKIYPEFFNNYTGIKGSFVSLIICNMFGEEGVEDERFPEAFVNSGANSVVGYMNSVYTNWALDHAEIYLASMLAGATSQEAYEYAIKCCGSTGNEAPAAIYKICSGPDTSTSGLPSQIINGDFEKIRSNKPLNWIMSGDVRSVVQLGTTRANKKFMAFISTGVGSSSGASLNVTGGTQGSSLSQKVICKSKYLKFTYDVFSEEPMEYVGSSYDDKFIVQIRNLSDGEIAVQETIESVNTSSWDLKSAVNFYGGDNTTYHTGGKTVLLKLPDSLQDKAIEISFIVCDVGDSQFDTAVVIDDVLLCD